MGKPFVRELADLQKTYDWVLGSSVEHISKTLKSDAHLPVFSVGSGGSYSAAVLQATLHQRFFNSIASSITPMELPGAIPANKQASIWFMSASGNNIDIRRAFKHAALVEPRSISVLLGNTGSKLAEIAKKFEYCNIFEQKLPAGKDGFLATNSLFGFSTLMYQAYCEAVNKKPKLPKTIDELIKRSVVGWKGFDVLEKNNRELWDKEHIHVIFSPNLKSVAVDIESKFVEAGLGSVLVSDLRNFAHGRHHWFAKNEEKSAIICLSTKEEADLGIRTLELLPDAPKLQLTFRDNNGEELLAGLLLSFYFTYWKGLSRNIDPGRPGVPQFGSKIYRLTAKSGFVSSIAKKEIAISRKISSGPNDNAIRKQWESEYNKFTKRLSKQNIGGIVLDYDGTAIDPRKKGRPPSEEICKELCRLMDDGVKIGFATGRGVSIRNELQSKSGFSKEYWKKIIIGYYNGAEIAQLSDNSVPDGTTQCIPNMAHIKNLILQNLVVGSLDSKVTERLHQITIEPVVSGSELLLWHSLNDVLKSDDDNNRIKMLRSSHSVDILAEYVTKLSVVNQIEDSIPNEQIVLTIGDMGRWPGNDCYLLSTPFSLSVDEVSAESDKCWNLCSAGHRGTQGLLEYLKRIRKNEKGIFFKN